MNFVLHGHAVSGGITVGYAHLVATARLEVAHYEIAPEAIDAEIARFDRAMQTAQEELQALKGHIAPDAPTPSGRWCSRWSGWWSASRRSTTRTCASARRTCSTRSSAC